MRAVERAVFAVERILFIALIAWRLQIHHLDKLPHLRLRVKTLVALHTPGIPPCPPGLRAALDEHKRVRAKRGRPLQPLFPTATHNTMSDSVAPEDPEAASIAPAKAQRKVISFKHILSRNITRATASVSVSLAVSVFSDSVDIISDNRPSNQSRSPMKLVYH